MSGRAGKPIWSDPCPSLDGRWEASGAPTAPWWRDGFEEAAFDRRTVLLVTLMGTGPLSLPGCALTGDYQRQQQGDQSERDEPSLDAQRREGWNVGAPDEGLDLPGAVDLDIDGGRAWIEALRALPWTLGPTQPWLAPWYVPTLFQAAAEPRSTALRAMLRPVYTDRMQRAFDVGRGLLALFQLAGQGGGVPADTLVVVDLPGGESVALAAALSPRFEPVFQFDNWPHPRGVVASQQVLGATLFYAPLLDRSRASRATPAPPVLVLDANRLAPYDDEADRFDNRYLARLPDAAALRRMGISHLLYVSEQGGFELDDLNDDLAALAETGIVVRQVAAGDFQPADPFDPDERAFAEGIAPAPAPEAGITDDDDEWTWSFDLPLYWGGSRILHGLFWDYYPWYRCRLRRHPFPLLRPAPGARMSAGWWYHPVRRATSFHAARFGGPAVGGVGILRARPRGFGVTHHGFGGFHGGSFARGHFGGWGG